MGTSIRCAPQAELHIGLKPVVLQGGEHIKSEYREVVLWPTDKRAHDRPVWSTVASVEMHLYIGSDNNWRLADKYTPEESSSMACFEGGSAVPPQGEGAWKLDKSMCREDTVEGKLLLLCGDEGAARAVRGLALSRTAHRVLYERTPRCALGTV